MESAGVEISVSFRFVFKNDSNDDPKDNTGGEEFDKNWIWFISLLNARFFSGIEDSSLLNWGDEFGVNNVPE